MKTRPMLVERIVQVPEGVLDGGKISTMNEKVQVVHLASRAITVQVFSQHRPTNWNTGNTFLFTRSQNMSEFFCQQ